MTMLDNVDEECDLHAVEVKARCAHLKWSGLVAATCAAAVTRDQDAQEERTRERERGARDQRDGREGNTTRQRRLVSREGPEGGVAR